MLTVQELLNKVVASDQSNIPTKDAGPSQSTSYKYTTSSDMTLGSVADLTDAPAIGQKIVITDIIISAAIDMLFTLKEETTGTTLGAFRIPSDTPIQLTPRGKWKLSTADKKVLGQASVAGYVYVIIFYYSET